MGDSNDNYFTAAEVTKLTCLGRKHAIRDMIFDMYETIKMQATGGHNYAKITLKLDPSEVKVIIEGLKQRGFGIKNTSSSLPTTTTFDVFWPRE